MMTMIGTLLTIRNRLFQTMEISTIISTLILRPENRQWKYNLNVKIRIRQLREFHISKLILFLQLRELRTPKPFRIRSADIRIIYIRPPHWIIQWIRHRRSLSRPKVKSHLLWTILIMLASPSYGNIFNITTYANISNRRASPTSVGPHITPPYVAFKRPVNSNSEIIQTKSSSVNSFDF